MGPFWYLRIVERDICQKYVGRDGVEVVDSVCNDAGGDKFSAVKMKVLGGPWSEELGEGGALVVLLEVIMKAAYPVHGQPLFAILPVSVHPNTTAKHTHHATTPSGWQGGKIL